MNNETRQFLESQLSLLENTVRVIFEVHSNVARQLRSINSPVAAGQEPPALPDNYQVSIAEYSASVARSSRNLLEEFNNTVVPTAPVRVPTAPARVNVIPLNPSARLEIRQPLSREVFEERSEHVCGICLEAHMNGYTVTCECNHRFGKKCFINWTKACTRAKRAVTCPTCRQPVKKMNVPFMKKATPIPVPEPLIGAPHVVEF